MAKGDGTTSTHADRATVYFGRGAFHFLTHLTICVYGCSAREPHYLKFAFNMYFSGPSAEEDDSASASRFPHLSFTIQRFREVLLESVFHAASNHGYEYGDVQLTLSYIFRSIVDI